MLISDFDYFLPPELIAQYPLAERSESRLLTINNKGHCAIRAFGDLYTLLSPGDLVIANDTKVIPARLMARKPTGGKVEIMLERVVNDRTALVQLRSNKPLKSGQELIVGDSILVVRGREERFYLLQCADHSRPGQVFESLGSVPLPPYIDRPPEQADATRYQTVYSSEPGAVAAPTAGLHIDEALLERFACKQIGWETLTLHVGAGTFLPVSADRLDAHVMHAERFVVNEKLCKRITRTREIGGSIVAIGTTVVRALESAARSGTLLPYEGETSLFIKPGFRFNVVDKLITNFHLPRSTLLVLVSAFAGADRIKRMYDYAIEQELRFFSYGDAMLLERQDEI